MSMIENFRNSELVDGRRDGIRSLETGMKTLIDFKTK